MCLNRLDICMLHYQVRGRSAGSFPEQRLVIELNYQVIRDKVEAGKNHDSKVVLLWKKSSTCQWFQLLTVVVNASRIS